MRTLESLLEGLDGKMASNLRTAIDAELKDAFHNGKREGLRQIDGLTAIRYEEYSNPLFRAGVPVGERQDRNKMRAILSFSYEIPSAQRDRMIQRAFKYVGQVGDEGLTVRVEQADHNPLTFEVYPTGPTTERRFKNALEAIARSNENVTLDLGSPAMKRS